MKTGIFLILLMLDAAAMAFAQSAPEHRLDPVQLQLVNSMITRLQLSKEVAWTKFCHHIKVRDPVREAKVLASLTEEGRAMGLPDGEVSYFFKPQIVASCRYQDELIASWRNGRPPPFSPPMDLQQEIRPLLDKVTREMLLEWKSIPRPMLNQTYRTLAGRIIGEQGISEDVARIAARPLADLPR